MTTESATYLFRAKSWVENQIDEGDVNVSSVEATILKFSLELSKAKSTKPEIPGRINDLTATLAYLNEVLVDVGGDEFKTPVSVNTKAEFIDHEFKFDSSSLADYSDPIRVLSEDQKQAVLSEIRSNPIFIRF